VYLSDAHCHLQSKHFDGGRDEVIARAETAGVVHMLNCATEPSDWGACRVLSKEHSSCLFALGIHPWYIPDQALEFLARLALNDFSGAKAVGEIGLDKRSGSDIGKQTAVFRKQFEIAHELDLPAVLHCVSAFQEIIAELKRCPLRKGALIHNYNGSAELAKDLMKHNIYFSMGGTLTYRDSQKRAEALKAIYPERFLLETDSPDIPPAEKRGTVNEPSNIIYNLKAAAEILSISEEEIAEQTYLNFKRLFNID
jgi:TatD DNase family protein